MAFGIFYNLVPCPYYLTYSLVKCILILVQLEGFEPPAYEVEARCSYSTELQSQLVL